MAERSPGFLNPDDFPFTARLESAYPEIRRELMSILKRGSWSRYVDHDQRRGGSQGVGIGQRQIAEGKNEYRAFDHRQQGPRGLQARPARGRCRAARTSS